MREVIKPGVVLCLVTLIATALLGVVNTFTADIIKEREAEEKRRSMAIVLPLAYDDNFSEANDVSSDNVTAYNIGYDENGEVCGYVFSVDIKGYSGRFEVLVGLDASGVITGVAIGANSETPGLGKNIEKDNFKKQYIGKSGVLTVVKSGASDNEIDAVTSATISSTAVTSGVNFALTYFNDMLKGADE